MSDCTHEKQKFVCMECSKSFCSDCGYDDGCVDVRSYATGAACHDCLASKPLYKTVGGMGSNAGHNAVRELDAELRLLILPQLDVILQNRTNQLNKALSDQIEHLRAVSPQLTAEVQRVIAEVQGVITASGKAIVEVRRVAERVALAVDGLAPAANAITESVRQTRDLVKDVAPMLEHAERAMRSLAPIVNKLAQAAQPGPPTFGETIVTLTRTIHMVERHLDRLETFGNAWLEDRERERQFGLSVAIRNAFLIITSGFIFCFGFILTGSMWNTFTLLRSLWGAMTVAGLLIFGGPLLSDLWRDRHLAWGALTKRLSPQKIGNTAFILVVLGIGWLLLGLAASDIHGLPPKAAVEQVAPPGQGATPPANR